MRFSFFVFYVNSLKSQIWSIQPIIESLVRGKLMRIDPLYSFRAVSILLASHPSGWLARLVPRHCFTIHQGQKRTLACSPPDNTWIWLSICLVVKPQRARAAWTSAWLRLERHSRLLQAVSGDATFDLLLK